MKISSQTHALALALLARPVPDANTMALLHGLVEHAGLLWNREPDHFADEVSASAAPDVAVFNEAVDHLSDVGDISIQAVVMLMQKIGHDWRYVPAAALHTMALALTEAADQTRAAMEVRHVACWFKRALLRTAQATLTWPELVSAALTWQANDEISLRQQPYEWAVAVSFDLRVSGFELQPIFSTQQLVETNHHKGVLCSVALARACQSGLQAWFYARSTFSPAPVDLCLFGLIRNAPDEPWQTKEAYAPTEFLDNLHQLAMSIGARANASDRLAALRQNTLGTRASLASLTSWSNVLRFKPREGPQRAVADVQTPKFGG